MLGMAAPQIILTSEQSANLMRVPKWTISGTRACRPGAPEAGGEPLPLLAVSRAGIQDACEEQTQDFREHAC